MSIDKINFIGDVWLKKNSLAVIPQQFADDLVINLEGPITSRGVPVGGKICLATDVNAFCQTFKKMPLAACLANNHIMDYGLIGFKDTLDVLNANGIKYFGAGTLANRCNNPLIIKNTDFSIALLGYVCPTTHPIFAVDDAYGVAPIRLDIIEEDIVAARHRGADRIIVCLHWGDEEVGLPKPSDIEIARGLINMGVNLVIGHHSHCLQPLLIENGKYVFFGLGNAMFPDFEYHVDGKLSAWSKQRWWNLTTAVITYQPKAGLVNWQILRSYKGVLKKISTLANKIKVWETLPADSDVYKNIYKNNKKFRLLRNAISRFLARPKLPTPQSVRHIITSLRHGK